MLILTRKPCQSLSIQPHPILDPGTPVEQLFVGGPIQVQVLGVQGVKVAELFIAPGRTAAERVILALLEGEGSV